MGAWGVEAFENDQALDWAWELGKSEDDSFLVKALQTVNDLPGDEYIDGRPCRQAIAAAEVIAAMKGVPLKVLPDNVNNWLQKHAGLYTQELSSQALAAIERILSNSELKELWDDSKSAEKWYAAMSDLQDRLRT